MELGIAGRVAVVTAASKGIGAATALALAEEGVSVVCCARGEGALAALEAAAAGQPGKIRTFEADLMVDGALDRFLDAVESELGAPDILVNNLGASPSRNFLYMTPEDWQTGLHVNLMVAIRASQRVLPAMRAKHWGRIVMVSSGAAKTPSAPLVDYSAAKAAMVSVAKSLARKYGADGVLVNSVLPGLIRTAMWEETAEEIATKTGGNVEAVFEDRGTRVPVGRFGTAREVADAIVFLASERASYLNGAALDVDGGLGAFVF